MMSISGMISMRAFFSGSGAGDINGHVSVQPKPVRQIFLKLVVTVRLFVNADIAQLVHGQVDHVGFGIAFGHGCCGQVHLDGLQTHHAQAGHHERGQQEKHNINERDDLDPRLFTGNCRTDFHKGAATLASVRPRAETPSCQIPLASRR